MKRNLLVAMTLFAGLAMAQTNPGTTISVQLVRNATLLLEYGGKKILVDPMLSPKGVMESWAGIEKNPTVDLVVPIHQIVEDLDLVLVTHVHPDHFDDAASKVLDKSIRLINQPADKTFFEKRGFSNASVLDDHILWNTISIMRIDAQHGSGEVLEMMGKTSGFVLKAENQPTVYIVGDAIWTDEVKSTIKKFNPDYIIVNSGGAYIQGFDATPIIMDEAQTMDLIGHSGKAKVIAVHMDALDHCRTTRKSLKHKAAEFNVGTDKLIIPQDGEKITLSL